jgi:hypothetical protein
VRVRQTLYALDEIYASLKVLFRYRGCSLELPARVLYSLPHQTLNFSAVTADSHR